MNQSRNLTDITFRLSLLLDQWQEQLASINRSSLARLPEFMQEIASQSAVNVYFSPDREKLLYTATKDLEIPSLIEKLIPSINPTPQNRSLAAGKTYVYDLKEDSNYLIKEAQYNPETAQFFITDANAIPQPIPDKKFGSQITSEFTSILNQIYLIRGQYDPHTTQNLSWYSTNRHLVITNQEGVSMVEYDDNNLTPIIGAQIAGGLAASSPDGSHLIILSNMNQKPDVFNLISLDLK